MVVSGGRPPHWLEDKAGSWGIGTAAWNAFAGSHRQSKMEACTPMRQHTQPGWQNLQSMQGTVACYPASASGLQHLPGAGGAGVLRFSRLRAEGRGETGGTEWNTCANREFRLTTKDQQKLRTKLLACF